MPPRTRKSVNAVAAGALADPTGTPGPVTRRRAALNAPHVDKVQEPQQPAISIQATSAAANGAGQKLQGVAAAPTPTAGNHAQACTTTASPVALAQHEQQQPGKEEFIQELIKKWQRPHTLQGRVRKYLHDWLFRLDFFLGANGSDWWETLIVYSLAVLITVLVAYSAVKQLWALLWWLAKQPPVKQAMSRLWQA